MSQEAVDGFLTHSLGTRGAQWR